MTELRVGSTFSGVGGIDLGLERAGMRVVFQCEADAWCRGILAQHWPDVPCYEDVRALNAPAWADRLATERRTLGRIGNAPDANGGCDDAKRVDLIAGGSPCQDLSAAGQRAGLYGEKSGLFFEFARVADEFVRAGGWLLFENVPGLLSSFGGSDFAIVLRTLGDLGFHDLAWRVLDSRYFGVPQRRRRIFIVARRATGTGAREVLLEPESGGGDFAPRDQARSRAPEHSASGVIGVGLSDPDCAGTLGGRRGFYGDDIDRGGGFAIGFHATQDPISEYEGTPALGRRSYLGVRTSSDTNGVREASSLPGRLDDPRPDGPRYNAMGNAVTVNVAEWIGRRIVAYEATASGAG